MTIFYCKLTRFQKIISYFCISLIYVFFGFLGIHKLWNQKIIGIIYLPITFNALNLLATKNVLSHLLSGILFLFLIILIIYDIYCLWNFPHHNHKPYWKSIVTVIVGFIVAFILCCLSIWLTTDLGLVPVKFR